MLKEWLNKLRKKQKQQQEKKQKTTSKSITKKSKLSIFKKKTEYPNRFLKFYHVNKSRLNKERRGSYSEHKSRGICVRCSKKSLSKIVFCSYHQQKQKGYNKKARGQ